MSKYDRIPPEVKEYYERRIRESNIKMVPGHYPVLMTKEEVDQFFDMKEKAFALYFEERNMPIIKERVVMLAKRNNLSIPGLEKILGFGSGTISRWDESSPTVENLQKVADYFNVSVDYLLGRSNCQNPIDVNSLSYKYLSFAKEAEEKGIDPDDIKMALNIIKYIRGKR